MPFSKNIITDRVLPFEVIKTPVAHQFEGEWIEQPGQFNVVRSDNGVRLSRKSVSGTYQVFKNSQFTDIIEDLESVSGGAFTFKNYALWKDGAKTLAIMKNNSDAEICGLKASNYLTVLNGNDGTLGLSIGFTNTLVRCDNQFGQINKKFKIKHTNSMNSRLSTAQRIIKGYVTRHNYFKEIAEKGMQVKIDRKLIERCIDVVLGHDPAELENHGTAKRNKRMKLETSIETECKDLGYNAWGLFNGVTHYTTHKQATSGDCFNLFGTANTVNEKGFSLLEDLVLS